jgi:hypothetical protein
MRRSRAERGALLSLANPFRLARPPHPSPSPFARPHPSACSTLIHCAGMLSDTIHCKVLGAALAARMPEGTEYLLMPDGKAQALLHVTGRLTGLPTVVAKKEVNTLLPSLLLAIILLYLQDICCPICELCCVVSSTSNCAYHLSSQRRR